MGHSPTGLSLKGTSTPPSCQDPAVWCCTSECLASIHHQCVSSVSCIWANLAALYNSIVRSIGVAWSLSCRSSTWLVLLFIRRGCSNSKLGACCTQDSPNACLLLLRVTLWLSVLVLVARLVPLHQFGSGIWACSAPASTSGCHLFNATAPRAVH
jgi:hypothetical protein